MAETTKLEALSAHFDVDDVKQRKQAGRTLDYIGIDATIRRLNEVLGSAWSTDWLTHSLTPLETGEYLAVVSLTLTALEKQSVGIGADVAKDPDKALKTALAEALKKAGHQYGIGLYLWQESEREVVAQKRQANESISGLKARVFELALAKGATPTAKGVAETLGIEEKDLQDADALRRILGENQ